MRRAPFEVGEKLQPALSRGWIKRAFALILALLLPAVAAADQSLLSYSLSSAHAAANSFWQTSRRNSERAAIQQTTPLTYDAPVWAEKGVHDLRLSLRPGISETIGAHYFKLPAIRKLQPGIGDYFPNDTVGRSRFNGTGVEDLRWIYLKIKVLGRH